MEVKGEPREKRKNERSTETDKETHRTTRQRYRPLITLSMSLCLLSMSMFATYLLMCCCHIL